MAEAAASDDPPDVPSAATRKVPLDSLHRRLGARMVPFAGYDMPVQYPAGIIAEHQWTRENAGLFDVSHMGQAFLVGPSHAETASALEALCPADIQGLAPGRQRYTQLLDDTGGILDDLMVVRSPDPSEDGALMLVVNAARKQEDFALLRERLPAGIRLLTAEHRGLLALQGPKAAEVLARHAPEAAAMGFMTARSLSVGGMACHVTRSGYTGEDGYEVSVHVRKLEDLADLLLREPEVKPIGLGARDSLRLEAGLCLYGHDIDTTTSPVEAVLGWSIQRRRREEGGFPGAARIQREFAQGPARLRVGLVPEGRQPAREGCEITTPDGRPIGRVTSGGFGPTVNGPVAMGYVEAASAAAGTPVAILVRGKPLAARIAPLPFVPHRYAR